MTTLPPPPPQNRTTPGWIYLTEIQRYECLRHGYGDRQQMWLTYENDFRTTLQQHGSREDREALEDPILEQLKGYVGLTPYESHVLSFLLYWSAERAQVGLKRLGLSLQTPILGTIPSRHVNAMVLRHPESLENILIFDDAMILLARSYAELVAYLMPDLVLDGPLVADRPWGTRKRVLEVIRGEEWAISQVCDLLSSFVFDGQYLPQEIDPRGERAAFANFLGEAALVSVMGHEFGHLHAGDLEPLPERYRSFKGGWYKTAESKTAEIRWLMEHEADFFGLGVSAAFLSEEYGDTIHPIYRLAGPFTFLQFFWLLERCIRFTVTGSPFPGDSELETPTEARSHPPPANRFAELVKRVIDEVDLAPAFADLFLCMNIVLTEECVKQLDIGIKQGRSLHSSWQDYREEEGL